MEWLEEPIESKFEHAGLKCYMRRASKDDYWRGYVELSSAHPLCGVGYSTPHESLNALLADSMEKPVGEDIGTIAIVCSSMSGEDPRASMDLAIRVHGGVTFADKPYWDGTDSPWAVGFDCAHCYDLDPARNRKWNSSEGVYRNVEYVTNECKKLAEQLASVMPAAKS